MAGACGAFIVALNHSTVANVLFLQALAPFAAVALAWVTLRESATRRTWAATGLAVSGVAVMVGGPSSGSMLGLLASIAMTVLFAITIVITRHRREVSMAPAVALAQLMLFAVAAPFASLRGSGRTTCSCWCCSACSRPGSGSTSSSSARG